MQKIRNRLINILFLKDIGYYKTMSGDYCNEHLHIINRKDLSMNSGKLVMKYNLQKYLDKDSVDLSPLERKIIDNGDSELLQELANSSKRRNK